MTTEPLVVPDSITEIELKIAMAEAGDRGVLIVPAALLSRPSVFSDELHKWAAMPLYTPRLGYVYEIFEKAGVADYTARDIVSALRDAGVDFERPQRKDAWTCRGNRNPNTLTDMMPIAAYNLGWQEARDSVAAHIAIEPEEGEMIASGGGWRSQHPIEDDGEHAHYTREGRDRCAAGDHEAAELFDREAEAAKIKAHIEDVYDVEGSDMATAAEEPIEQRLHRAFLNGYREGSERASWGVAWDHSR